MTIYNGPILDVRTAEQESNTEVAGQNQCIVSASSLLEKSATPFDEACMKVKELEVAIEDFALDVNRAIEPTITMPPFMWDKYRKILKAAGIDENLLGR